MPSFSHRRYVRFSQACAIPMASVALVSLLPGAASAQVVASQVGVASEYIGKGIGKSDSRPSLLASSEVVAGPVYVSVFASTARLSQGSDAEIITTVGFRPVVRGVTFDLAVLNRDLPGSRQGIDSNYFEYQADASRAFGPVNARLRVNYSPDGFAATREAWWVELQGSMALDATTKASLAIADRSTDGGADYVAWNAGVKRKLTDHIALDLRWFDTDGHQLGEPYAGRLVAALSLSF